MMRDQCALSSGPDAGICSDSPLPQGGGELFFAARLARFLFPSKLSMQYTCNPCFVLDTTVMYCYHKTIFNGALVNQYDD